MSERRRSTVAIGLGLIAGLTACSVVLGLRDGYPDSGDGGNDGGPIDDQMVPPPDVPPVGFDGSAASCDGGLSGPVEDPNAIHVDPTGGVNASDCGTAEAPCKTLAAALVRTKNLAGGTAKIELAVGTYNEAVTITNVLKSLTIEGGFVRSGNSWTGQCLETLVTVANYDGGPPGNGTIHMNSGANVTFRLFTVDTMLRPSAFGASVHALVLEPGATATLENMSVLSQLGAPGQGGGVGGTLSNGGCVSDNGQPGSAGAAGGAGAYTPQGYVPAFGATGNKGSFGSNTDGGSGNPYGTCMVNCGTPMMVGSSFTCSSPLDIGPGNTQAGTGGCGGGAGLPGTGGQGGGASVAIIALNGSTLVLRGVRFLTQGGGTGGPGGDGGPGTSGVDGSAGNSQVCITGCSAPVGSSCGSATSSATVPGGTGGPPGGPGGNGGAGGGGAGGPAHFIAHGAAATINGLDQIRPGSSNGAGGTGGGTAPPGPSETVKAF